MSSAHQTLAVIISFLTQETMSIKDAKTINNTNAQQTDDKVASKSTDEENRMPITRVSDPFRLNILIICYFT